MPHKRSKESRVRRKLKGEFKRLYEMKSLWVDVNAQSNKITDFETNEVDLLKGISLGGFILPDGTVIKDGTNVLEWDDVEKHLIELGIISLPKYKENDIIWIRNQQLDN